MLDGVRRQVDLQRGRVRVRPVAVGALVGLVLVVLALVGLREQRESGGDHGDPAPPAPGGPHTDLEVGELGEGLLAAGVRALVGSVAGVDSGDTHTLCHCHLPFHRTVLSPSVQSHQSAGLQWAQRHQWPKGVTEEKGGRHGAERRGLGEDASTVTVVGMMSVEGMDWHAWTGDHGGVTEGGGGMGMKKVAGKSTVELAEHGGSNKGNGDDEHGGDGECGVERT